MISGVGADCTGCLACAAACPLGCIETECRELGHVYPKVDAARCVGCGACAKACHVLRHASAGAAEAADAADSGAPEAREPKVFAAQALDANILDKSSSGGAFSLLAAQTLAQGGVVYGAKWDKGHGAAHCRIDSEDGLAELRRSKYVQSATAGVFAQIARDLKEGRTVLFVGTPCQVAAVKAQNPDAEGLLTVDLVCHGVPSAQLFEGYLSWLEERGGSTIAEYRSRDKAASGWSYLGAVSFEGDEGAFRPLRPSDPYVALFNAGATFRTCCFACKYAGIPRIGDITLGDFWGVERLGLGFDLSQGVSLVLANTEKGEGLLEAIKGEAAFFEAGLADAARLNRNLMLPSVKPEIYEDAARSYEKGGFAGLAELARQRLWRSMLANELKRLVPSRLKQWLKAKLA